MSVASDSGTYRIHASASNLYLDMAGGSTADGGGLIQWAYSGASIRGSQGDRHRRTQRGLGGVYGWHHARTYRPWSS